MSVLYLVRHGQAMVEGDDYDELSAIGAEQSNALGNFWIDRGLSFDRVLVGPRRRHRQTHDEVAAVYQDRGAGWPEPEPRPELDEHHGQQLFERYRPRKPPEELADLSREARLVRYLKAYQDGTRRWVRGEIETPPDLEPWKAFRARAAAGLDDVVDGGERRQKVVAFTSGGAIAAWVGAVLDLADEKIMELSWRVKNASVSELLFSPGRGASLHTFNTTPHLSEPRLLTYI